MNAHDKAVRPIAREDITAMFLDWRPNRFPRTWAYADSNELSAALDAIGHVLDLVLEPLERELRALLDPLPATLPEQVSRRPYDSWAGALDEAESLAHEIDPTAFLVRARSEVSAGSRSWEFRFGRHQRSIDVFIPAAGPVRRWVSTSRLGDPWFVEPKPAGRIAINRMVDWARTHQTLEGLAVVFERGAWRAELGRGVRAWLRRDGELVTD